MLGFVLTAEASLRNRRGTGTIDQFFKFQRRRRWKSNSVGGKGVIINGIKVEKVRGVGERVLAVCSPNNSVHFII